MSWDNNLDQDYTLTLGVMLNRERVARSWMSPPPLGDG